MKSIIFSIFTFSLSFGFGFNSVGAHNVYDKKQCVVLFTGGSNFISPELYSDFIDTLNPSCKVYKIPFNMHATDEKRFTEYLKYKYNDITFLGHSSGCITALNKCYNGVNRLVLLDPVKTVFFNKDKNLDFLNNILIINAEKSYKWSMIPPFVPFIPAFRLNLDDINIDKKKLNLITVLDYGHSDIINNPYRNLMHYSRISVGFPNREKEYINRYHKFISKMIDKFIEIDNPNKSDRLV